MSVCAISDPNNSANVFLIQRFGEYYPIPYREVTFAYGHCFIINSINFGRRCKRFIKPV